MTTALSETLQTLCMTLEEQLYSDPGSNPLNPKSRCLQTAGGDVLINKFIECNEVRAVTFYDRHSQITKIFVLVASGNKTKFVLFC